MGQDREYNILDQPQQVRVAQARRDAVAAIAQCMLPLEPQNPPRHSAWSLQGIGERAQRAWHDYNEPESYQCAVAELRAKPRTYRVPAFTRMEEDDLMQQGMRRASEMPAGSTRPRRYGRD